MNRFAEDILVDKNGKKFAVCDCCGCKTSYLVDRGISLDFVGEGLGLRSKYWGGYHACLCRRCARLLIPIVVKAEADIRREIKRIGVLE